MKQETGKSTCALLVPLLLCTKLTNTLFYLYLNYAWYSRLAL
jgi:hypothetical protein